MRSDFTKGDITPFVASIIFGLTISLLIMGAIDLIGGKFAIN